MKIEEIKIENFKGITTLEFKPKNINFIIGKNNTGKTSLLESIYLFFYPERNVSRIKHSLSMFNFQSKYFEIIAKTNGKKHSIKVEKATENETIYEFKRDFIRLLDKSLHEIGKEMNIELRNDLEKKINELLSLDVISYLKKESVILTKDNTNKKVYYKVFDIVISSERDENRKRFISFIEEILKYLGNKIQIEKENRKYRRFFDPIYTIFEFDKLDSQLNLDERQVVFIKDPISTLSFNMEKEFHKNDEKEIAENLYSIEQILKKYDLIKNLEKLNDIVIFKYGNDTFPIPFEQLGDGSKAIIGLLWYISSKKMNNKIILLDEPEIHMHPGYIKELVKMIIKFSKELNIQFFISTHNIDFIDMLFDETLTDEEKKYLKDEILILTMEKSKEMYTSAEVLNYESSKEIKDLLIDLRGV